MTKDFSSCVVFLENHHYLLLWQRPDGSYCSCCLDPKDPHLPLKSIDGEQFADKPKRVSWKELFSLRNKNSSLCLDPKKKNSDELFRTSKETL